MRHPGWAAPGGFGSLLPSQASLLGMKLQVTQYHTFCCWWALSLETQEPQISPLIPFQTQLGEQMVEQLCLSPQLASLYLFFSAMVNFVDAEVFNR